MRAAIFNGPHSITVGQRPDPVIVEPTDAIVRVVLGCVCGSDLWYYRGESPHAVGSIGHEFIGVVEDIGAEVTGITAGDLVIAPFIFSDMSCPDCQNGSTISCVRGGNFGDGVIDGGQGEAVRVPLAGSTLVPVPGSGHSEETLRSLLSLSDVMSTGHHAFAEATAEAHTEIDAAYHAKYDRYGATIVGHVTGPDAQPVTIRLTPKDRADDHQ
jgi:threonine dehydrogenase-like Zn-dependent dehydrogenase